MSKMMIFLFFFFPNEVIYFTLEVFLPLRFSETVSSSGSARNSISHESDQTIPAEDLAAKSLFTAQHKLQELLATEKTYVEKNLKEIVEGYYKYMEESKANPEGRIKIPTDLTGGRNRIIFGNIRDIYDFHIR